MNQAGVILSVGVSLDRDVIVDAIIPRINALSGFGFSLSDSCHLPWDQGGCCDFCSTLIGSSVWLKFILFRKFKQTLHVYFPDSQEYFSMKSSYLTSLQCLNNSALRVPLINLVLAQVKFAWLERQQLVPISDPLTVNTFPHFNLINSN